MGKKPVVRKTSAGRMMADLHKYLRTALGSQCPTMIEMTAYCIEFHRTQGRALALDELVEHFKKRQKG